MERRKEKRTLRINPIRYKKKGDVGYNVGEVVNLTDEGFCMIMPVGLSMDNEFEFEAFDGGKSIKGLARVVWMGRGNTQAGCKYTL